MALFECSHRSDAIDKRMQFNVIIPDSFSGGELPCLYLLHGLYDDYTMWQRMTGVERYANERGLAVVMPDGGKSFYTDMKYGYRYFSYVSDEIVAYTRKVFPLSCEREKTFVAGNSMGGYGAFKLALAKPDMFGAAVSFSGALHLEAWNERGLWDPDAVNIWGEDGFGKIAGSENDLFYLAKRAAASAKELPRLYQICGTEDFLYSDNVKFRDFVSALPYDYKYDEMPGSHNWGFWDANLARAMDYLLEKDK